MRRRTYEQYVVPRPRPRWSDIVTTLRHFALVTYTIDPDALRGLLPPRLSPLTIELDGKPRALLSVVIFLNTDFRPALLSGPRLNMEQINYRVYVIDELTGDHAIWFLGTLLNSWAFAVPRFVWKMPWRMGSIRLRYEYDDCTELYKSYSVTSDSPWAPAALELFQQFRGTRASTMNGPEAAGVTDPVAAPNGNAGTDGFSTFSRSDGGGAADAAAPITLPGFPDVETGLVCLTHVAKGFFRRRDGKIGLNRVWHGRIPVKSARLARASFPLLERWQLVPHFEQAKPYSVLIAPEVEFISELPPTIVAERG